MVNLSVIIPTMNRQEAVLRCVESVLDSEYTDIEVIVVDNASDDGVCDDLKFYKDKNLQIICSDKNLGAGGGRNLGAASANGEYLLFLDDDNVVEMHMISNLVNFLSNNSDKYVMAGPIMLYLSDPNIIWMRYVRINMFTSQAVAEGCGKKYTTNKTISETGLLPNCFIVRKKDFEKVGVFDEKYLVMYEEADIAHRLKSLSNKKIAVVQNAVTYHDVDIDDFGLTLTCKSRTRAYLTARNRIYFMKKNASLVQLISFSFIFFPLVTFIYLFSLLKNGMYKEAQSYIRGSIAGWYI